MIKSPHENANIDLVEQLGKGVKKAAILFEDAVYYAVDKGQRERLSELVDEIYVMTDDLAARGFQGRAEGKFKEITYEEAVDVIMERYDRTITI
jgi:sulfur relay protein TusB/DsrH